MILELIAAAVAGAVSSGAVTFGYYRFSRRYAVQEQHVLPQQAIWDVIDDSVISGEAEVQKIMQTVDGLSVVAPKTKVITTEEHCQMLMKKYSKEYKQFDDYHERRHTTIHQRGSHRIMQNLLAVEAGEMTVTIGRHTMDFSNGDEIWIANKYHSYGYIWTSAESGCEFTNDSGRLDPYVWLRVVELEEKLTGYPNWKPKTVRVNV